MSTEEEIAKLIENRQFSSALQRLKGSKKAVHQQVDSSYRLFKELYRFCDNSNKDGRKPSPSEVDGVCDLTLFLCKTISSTWKCNRVTVLICLYHTNRYLLEANPLQARRVSEYFFLFKKCSWDKEWEPKEFIIISNVVRDFTFQLINRYFEILSSSGDNSLASWLDFMFRLYELQDYKQVYKLFHMIDSIWVKVYYKCKDKLIDCVALCWSRLGKWLGSSSEVKVTATDTDMNHYSSLVERTISILSDQDIIDISGMLETSTVNFKILTSSFNEEINILLNLFNFYSNTGNPSCFDTVFSVIMDRQCKKSCVLPCVVAVFTKFCYRIKASSSLVESRLDGVLKLLLELMTWSYEDSVKPSKSSKMVVDLSYVAMSVASAPGIPKESFISAFSLVKRVVKVFLTSMKDCDDNVNFGVGVSAILTVMLAYKKIERFDEATWLCRYVLQIFLKIDPEILWSDSYLQSYVTTWLRNVVFSYSKLNMGVEAQVMLIVFAAYQPKYTLSIMKEWASLKTTSCQSINMDATVVDVMKVNFDEIEKHFPQLKLADINLDLLLLGEIYGYSKFRKLCGDPVLVVYKTAAKTVKDLIVLANILCCAVEAFSLNSTDTSYAPQLEASLHNMIKRLQTIQDNDKTPDKDSATTLCTIGNLLYHKMRLEIQQSRKTSEAEVAQNEKRNSKKKIPVLQAGEKDDLDMTDINIVGSTYKSIQDLEVFSMLKDAVNHWTLCATTVCSGQLGRQGVLHTHMSILGRMNKVEQMLQKSTKYEHLLKSKKLDLELVPNTVLEPTLSFVKGAGYLARLYSYKGLETTCWDVLYKIATKLNSLKYQTLAAAELLFSCRDVDQKIIHDMDEILQNPKRADRKNYVYHLYRTNYARNLLYRGKVDEFQQALEAVDSSAVSPFFLVKAQLTILTTFRDIEKSRNEAPLLPMTKLFENILYIIIHNQWETFNEACVVQFLMFDLSWILGTTYSDLQCVRLARLYTKTVLKVVERLALPVRVCEFMTLKCWIDLLTWNVTDSNMNAREVENILELSSLSPENSSLGGYKCIPHFLKEKNCCCKLCTCIDYPPLVLTAIVNRIQIIVVNNDQSTAQNVINVGLSIVKILEENPKSFNHLWTPLSSSVAKFYYVVAKIKALWREFKEAARYAKMACKLLELEPVKRYGMITSLKQLILTTDFVENFVETNLTIPVPRGLAVQQKYDRAVTPENQKYSDTKLLESTAQKPQPKRFFTQRKSLYNKNLDFGDSHDENDDQDFKALEALTPVNIGKAKNPTIVISDEVHEDDLKDEKNKLQRAMATLNLNGDGVTPIRKVKASSRKAATEKKARIPRTNLFDVGGISSLSKTPAVKVFYDPDGLEHSTITKRNVKTKDVKKTTRLAEMRMKEDKMGTPMASKANIAKNKLALDQCLDDELGLGKKKKGKTGETNKNLAVLPPSTTATSVETPKPDLDDSSLVQPFKKVLTYKNRRVIHDDTTTLSIADGDLLGDEKYKLQRAMAALNLNDDATPVQSVAVSSKKAVTEKKARIPRTNLFNAGSSSWAKTAKPAVKLFCDSDGMEHLANKETKDEKKTTRLGEPRRGLKKELGTPKQTKTKGVAVSKSKLSSSQSSDDELELVVEAKKRDKCRAVQQDQNAAVVPKTAAKCKDSAKCAETPGSSVGYQPSRNVGVSSNRRVIHGETVGIDESADSFLIGESRKVIDLRKRGLQPKKLIQDDTTIIEEVDVIAMDQLEVVTSKLKGQHKSVIDDDTTIHVIEDTSNEVESDETDIVDSSLVEPFRKVIGLRSKTVEAKRLIHDDTTIQSNDGSQAAKFGETDMDSDSSLVEPFRKVVASKFKETPFKKVINDDTTIHLNEETTETDCDNTVDIVDSSFVMPFRKVIGSTNKRVIHDDTTITSSTVESIVSSPVRPAKRGTSATRRVRKNGDDERRDEPVVLAKKVSRPLRSARRLD